MLNATSTCTYTACGNSYLDSGETCDDGNIVNSDGCSSTCQTEACYYCNGVGSTSCVKACENGVYTATGTYNTKVYTAEVCDEGASSDDLGCTN